MEANNDKRSGNSKRTLIIIIAAALILAGILLAVLLSTCGGSAGGPSASSFETPSGDTPSGDASKSEQPDPANVSRPEDSSSAPSVSNGEPADGTHFHAFGEWKTLAEPDCVNPGKRERTCSSCGFVQTQKTSPLGHDGQNNECVRCGKKAAEPEKFSISPYPNGDGLWITRASEFDDPDLLIPDTVSGQPVVCIASDAFRGNETIVSVSLPDSVTQFGSFCFGYCPNLQMLKFGRYFGEQYTAVHNGSPNLDFLTVDPDNRITHSDGNCIILTAAKKVIMGCRNSVIPDDGSATSLDSYSFASCYGLTSITIPSPVSVIGEYAFNNCRDLEKIEIDDSVTTIGQYALQSCAALKEVRLPAHLTTLDVSLFYNCASLESIRIPGEVTHVGAGCFEDCPSLKNVIIPDSVTEISNYAFKNCSSLEQISLPKGLQTLGSAFSGCTSLKEFSYPSEIDRLFSGTFKGCASLKKVTLPNNVETIPRTFLSDCTSLEEAIIPEGVTKLESYVFEGSDHLKKVCLPSTLKYVESDIFEGCSALQTVEFGGTKEQWDAIRWDEGDDSLKNATVICK